MKGFIRIFEAVIASIILLTSLSFFFKPQLIYTEWDDILLKTTANDIIAALYFNGSLSNFVFENNYIEINKYFDKTMPKTLGYSISVYGIPSPRVYILSLNEYDKNLSIDIISNKIKYREREIYIYFDNMSLSDIHPYTDIIFIYDYSNYMEYLDSNKKYIDDFLGRGGTIILVSSLSQEHLNDKIINETFGLAWGGLGSGDASGYFYNSDNVKSTSYKISNYLQNISIHGSNKNTKFNFSGNSGIKVDNRTIIKSSDDKSYVKINEHITKYGRGRAIWISSFLPIDDENELAKALVMWGSEDFKMDLYDKKIPDKYAKTFYAVGGKEPFLFEMTFWKIF